MINTDLNDIVGRVRELIDAGHLDESTLRVALVNIEECAERVAELEFGQVPVVKVTPFPQISGLAPGRRRTVDTAVVRLEDFRRRS